VRAIAATTVIVLAAAGCSSPSANNGGTSGGTGDIKTQQNALDPDAKGPAPEVQGAVKGGTLTVYSQSTPNTLDPTDSYFGDSLEIGKLIFRTPTQFAVRNGQPVLVPDLTDLGTVSADGLTWTFKLKSTGIKYEDGTTVKVDDIAYAIKRSFAHDLFKNGPTYQLTLFKDGATYKGPYASGDNYAGVETPDASTLVIHLALPFADLPFYMSFPMFTPIPKDKDNRQDYKNRPLATGPYKFNAYTPGVQLTLARNSNWDPATDPARHQYVDGWDFKWGADDVKTQQQVLDSNGPDAAALNYGNLDATMIPQLTGAKANQVVRGDAPCNAVYQIDARKVPLEVRKAIAKAHPYDQVWKAAGLNDYVAERSSTVLPPSVPGYTKYTPLPDLSGVGNGDPAGAKALLEAAGKVGFELTWYYDNTKTIPQQITQVRVDAYKAAGFNPKPIGVTTAELRAKTSDYDAPVNMGQSPAGWCSDWPSGSSWFPVLFQSHSIPDGTSWGMLSDPALDTKIDNVAKLPIADQTAKWSELDKEIMGMYVALPRYYNKLANAIGTKIGGAEGDPTMGLPLFQNLFIKSS